MMHFILVGLNKVHVRLLAAYVLFSICKLHIILFSSELLQCDQEGGQSVGDSKGLLKKKGKGLGAKYGPGTCANQGSKTTLTKLQTQNIK